jgi:hypothetical protein
MPGMKTRVGAAALLTFAALAWAVPAQAKELSVFRVCGAAGCTSVTDRAVLGTLIRAVESQGEAARVATPPLAPFLRLEYWVKGDLPGRPSFIQYYIPSRGVATVTIGPRSWSWVRPGAVTAALKRVSTAVTPFRAPRITAVSIGGATVRDPVSYVRLFTLEGKVDHFPDKPDWQRVVVETNLRSPWSTGAATLQYSRSTNVLWRGNDFVQLTPAIASRLEARRSLAGPSEGSFPWTLLFGGIGGAAVVLPTAVLFRRRRNH